MTKATILYVWHIAVRGMCNVYPNHQTSMPLYLTCQLRLNYKVLSILSEVMHQYCLYLAQVAVQAYF